VVKIGDTCKQLVTQLYTGENAKYLVGEQKIPEYLTIFLANMGRQVEEFKINCVRQLRMSTEKLTDLCLTIPKSVFHYLQFKFQTIIQAQINKVTTEFDALRVSDKQTKDSNMRLFRPNLENPANKQATIELNKAEQERC
jgi:hypothetical protein